MELKIDSRKSPVVIRTDCQELIDFLQNDSFPKRYIPEFHLDDCATEKGLVMVSEKSDEFKLDLDYPSRVIYHGSNIQIDTVVLLGYIMERIRQEKGVYSLHSSAVSKNRKGVVFIGDKMAGKTTLSLYCASNGFAFISDEKTLIDPKNGLIVGGNKIIAPNEFLTNQTDLDTTKSMNCASEANLNLIVYPRLYENPVPQLQQWSQQKVNMYFYAKFGEYICGHSVRLNNLQAPVESLDTLVLALQRIKDVEALTQSVPAYTIKGNKEAIFHAVNGLL